MFVSHPIHVLCLSSFPSSSSLLKDSVSSRLKGYDCCSGRNIVWITNRAALFTRSIQCSSLSIMVMMLSMNPYTDASVAVMSTANGSAISRWLSDWYFSSCGRKYRCGKFRSYLSQDSSRGGSFPSSIVASLTIVYSSGEVVAPKVNFRQVKASSSTIAMQVDTVVPFACIRR